MSGDLYWDSVALALHMDDVGLTDVKGHTMTLAGGTARSATESKFGGFSAYFDGIDSELYNTDPLAEAIVDVFSLQLWCRPAAQLMDNPCVINVQDLQIEFKPAGYPYGFVIKAGGVRTACGTYAEDAWHYIWIARTETTATVYINGIFIATVASEFYSSDVIYIGSNSLGVHPDSGFTGYIDDVLFTSDILRTDHSVPVAAFPETLPDPEGVISGALKFTGAAAGIVAPLGPISGALRITGAAVGDVLTSGIMSGALKFTGSAVGAVGRAGIVSGALRIIGAATGGHGRFGAISGALRITGAAVGKHGIRGQVSGALVITGAAVGSTPLVPVGTISGAMKITGLATGLGAPITEDACA